MSVINLLDSKVYNQISAGEVVENPASIVKELVENSIDSGASAIEIAILEGGIKSIIVSDNGCGMDKTDLHLSVMPHATSKIKIASDLDMISTLGFRGEALASIAAVSGVEIKSNNAGKANQIFIKGNELISEEETSLNIGTVIKINSLFFNTPARFKFLKAPKSEENAVTRQLLEIILANPDISFKYVIDGKIIFQTEGGGLKEALYSVFSSDIADNMIPILGENKGYKIQGYTARPATNAIKNNRKQQIIIINGRSIADLTISAVVQNAYTDKLMKRTFPSFILDIIAPFDMVDVNVHPNKKEVRFAEFKTVHGLIYHAIVDALNADEKAKISDLISTFNNSEKVLIDEQKETPFALPQEIEKLVKMPYQPSNFDTNFVAEISKNPLKSTNNELYLPNKGLEIKEDVKKECVVKFSDVISDITYSDKVFEDEKPYYHIIGQLFDTYLLIEFSDKLFIIDQHAVHEKILYNRIMDSYEKSAQSQDLLIPYEIDMDYEDIEYIKQNVNYLKKIGFEIGFCKNGININSIPAILMNLDIPAFFNDFVAEKSAEKGIGNSALRSKIATIACKSAIKGGDKLSDNQIRFVLEYFLDNNMPMQCPHGRPTISILEKTQIEKMFKRIV